MQPFNTKYLRLWHTGQTPMLVIFEVTRTDEISPAVFEVLPLLLLFCAWA
jgi:hypothetical protein